MSRSCQKLDASYFSFKKCAWMPFLQSTKQSRFREDFQPKPGFYYYVFFTINSLCT